LKIKAHNEQVSHNWRIWIDRPFDKNFEINQPSTLKELAMMLRFGFQDKK
jgi:hypothetical protein